MGNTLNQPITTQDIYESNFDGYEFVACGMQGYRKTMEDQHLISKIPGVDEHYILGIFDGHCGDECAKYIKNEIVNTLISNELFKSYSKNYNLFMRTEISNLYQYEVFFDESTKIIKKSVEESWILLDSKYREECKTTNDNSGTTAVVVIITPFHYFCINVGDSRAVLGSGRNFKINPLIFNNLPSENIVPSPPENIVSTQSENDETIITLKKRDLRQELVKPIKFTESKIYQLSIDHKPDNENENNRIYNAESFVSGGRVEGNLSLSRAFGDFDFKRTDLDPEKTAITCFPDIFVKIRESSDDYLILACDGLWDVMTSQEAIEYLRGAEKVCTSLKELTSYIVDESLYRGSKDNISVIVFKCQF